MCVHACMCARLCVCVFVCVCGCECVCVCACECVCARTHVCICEWFLRFTTTHQMGCDGVTATASGARESGGTG